MDRIEQIARVAYEAYMDGLIGCCELPWNKLPQEHRDRMIESQRAAYLATLRSIREPGGAALTAGHVALIESGDVPYFDSPTALIYWQAMIDHLIAETETPLAKVQRMGQEYDND